MSLHINQLPEELLYFDPRAFDQEFASMISIQKSYQQDIVAALETLKDIGISCLNGTVDGDVLDQIEVKARSMMHLERKHVNRINHLNAFKVQLV